MQPRPCQHMSRCPVVVYLVHNQGPGSCRIHWHMCLHVAVTDLQNAQTIKCWIHVIHVTNMATCSETAPLGLGYEQLSRTKLLPEKSMLQWWASFCCKTSTIIRYFAGGLGSKFDPEQCWCFQGMNSRDEPQPWASVEVIQFQKVLIRRPNPMVA